MNGYISAKLAQNVTGFCDEDLDILWQAILNMFEFDRSAARGNMAVRKLYVFKHSSALGDAPSWKLFDSIDVHKRDEVDVPRDFGDYEVRVNQAGDRHRNDIMPSFGNLRPSDCVCR